MPLSKQPPLYWSHDEPEKRSSCPMILRTDSNYFSGNYSGPYWVSARQLIRALGLVASPFRLERSGFTCRRGSTFRNLGAISVYFRQDMGDLFKTGIGILKVRSALLTKTTLFFYSGYSRGHFASYTKFRELFWIYGHSPASLQSQRKKGALCLVKFLWVWGDKYLITL